MPSAGGGASDRTPRTTVRTRLNNGWKGETIPSVRSGFLSRCAPDSRVRRSFLTGLLLVGASGAGPFLQLAGAELPSRRSVWPEVQRDGKSLVIGRFIGKFESPDFRSRRIVLRHRDTGRNETLSVDDGLGLISELVPPGVYDVEAIEAVYFPNIRPLNVRKFRPIRQRFTVSPREHERGETLISVPADRPVYIGTIRAGAERQGMVYEGQKLRVLDDFDVAMERLAVAYPALAISLSERAVVPQRHFMLRPTEPEPPLEMIVGMEDPIRQARRYIEDGKFEQAINWLSTFMPVSDAQRNDVRLLIGESHLGARNMDLAIEEFGAVLLQDPTNRRALRLLARSHSLNGDLEDTESLYRALLDIRPRDAEAHLQLGYLYALRADDVGAEAAFEVAFETDFDYLMHDLAPFLMAVRERSNNPEILYEPPLLRSTPVPLAGSGGSRRSAERDGIMMLIDHRGRVKSAHFAPESSSRVHQMMMSLVRGRYSPATLNGVAVPSIMALGNFGAER